MRTSGEDGGPFGVVGAPAEGADLAFVHELLEHRHHVLGGHGVVVADMELVEVDDLAVQASQTRLALLPH